MNLTKESNIFSIWLTCYFYLHIHYLLLKFQVFISKRVFYVTLILNTMSKKRRKT